MKSIKPTGRRSLVSVEEAMRRVEGFTPSKKIEAEDKPDSGFGSYLIMKDLEVYDEIGNIDERYDELLVADSCMVAHEESNILSLKESIVLCEQKGGFLPSAAMTFHILERLYNERDEHFFDTILDQYNYSNVDDVPMYVQNTILDCKRDYICHYPEELDNVAEVNLERNRSLYEFRFEGLNSFVIEEGLKDIHKERLIKQITGLKNLEVIIEIGKYFNKEAVMRLPEPAAQGICPVTIGCGEDTFVIDASGSSGARLVRGVKTEY